MKEPDGTRLSQRPVRPPATGQESALRAVGRFSKQRTCQLALPGAKRTRVICEQEPVTTNSRVVAMRR